MTNNSSLQIENYQIQINSSIFNNKATYKYGAIATTHELYEHILFFADGMGLYTWYK